jgi:acetyl esterase/lipase
MGTIMRVLAALLTGAAFIATPAMGQEVSTRELVWAKPDGLELQALIYRSADAPADAALPTVIDVHGGAWSAGDRTNGAVYAEGLARAGVQVISIDFRQGADFKHPAASADVTASVRWARLNAAALGVDPDDIGLIGSSSGGHLALVAGLKPNAPEHLGTPIVGPDGAAAAHDDIDASVDYVVGLWPVSDPLARFRYAQRTRNEALMGGGTAYFGDEANMTDASAPRIVTAGEAEDLPPVLIVQAGMDGNVPAEINHDMARAYESRDGSLEYAFFPGQAHGFGARPSPQTDDMIAMIASFIARKSVEPAS